MAMSASEVTYLQLNTSAIADSVSNSTATFNNRTLATPPSGFGSLSTRDFEVYLNNRRIPNTYVTSVTQNGLDIKVTVNVAGFLDITGAIFENDDEVLLVGKFT